MVKYTTTSTGKKAIVGSKHVIDGRTFEVLPSGKMKNLGKVSAAAPAKPMAKAKSAKKVTSPVVPPRRPDSPSRSMVEPVAAPPEKRRARGATTPVQQGATRPNPQVNSGRNRVRMGGRTGGGF